MGDLVVELYGQRLGVLRGDWRTFDLVPDPASVLHFGLDSMVMSIAVPLQVRSTRSRAPTRRNFFAELLPEGRMRTRLAQISRVAEHDVIGLLRQFGRDVAGALQIWDPEEPGEPKIPRCEPVTHGDIARMLTEVAEEPLGNKLPGGKTSLAGVQDKIVLARSGDGSWNRVLDGAPSTHILKPINSRFPTLIYDEEYGARLARFVGLTDYATWVEEFEGVQALVIERYDRDPAAPRGRVHQEDGNQVLGASGVQKYQRQGGVVTLERLARAFRRTGNAALAETLFRQLVVAVAVGDLDMHAKNISVLHLPDGSLRLAPVYDMVPQTHLPTDGELALAVNDIYQHALVTGADLVAEGERWGINNAASIAEETLARLAVVVNSEAPLPGAHPGLVDEIGGFIERLRQQ
ncbi:serine/threonine-protein kinase HipA [Actinobaculum suis]|uniref:HipA domain-containing protein n=1 Tax=Actinobaculum suis TaxID=1657 RepID=A0A1G7D9Q5_9ACTO|nr:HipA domain-containing protein [Actinobaculum suis]MDY5153335.1 HipA domain-containing protein [Actinobaculum suis]SDE48229.1 serine/threonine-protein kinase HipA [Actinobaculum suis]